MFNNCKFGWKAGTEQYPPRQLLEYTAAAEEAGFDSVSVSDHFHPWSERGQACFAWTWLGAAAAITKKMILGTGVTCPTLRYHPAVIAQAAATLDALIPERCFLGVGTGEALNEYSATGRWPSYQERRAQLAEAIRLIRALWSGEPVTHKDTHYETHKAKLYTRTDRPIPLYVSAMVPNSARFAGKYGDGLITVGGRSPEVYRQMLESFDASAAAADKVSSSLPRIIELAVDFTDDEELAISTRKAYWAGVFVPALFTERIYTPAMSEENGRAVGTEIIRQSACISNNPDDHVKFARRYIDMGFNHLIFHSAGPDQRPLFEAYGRHVLPQLRQT